MDFYLVASVFETLRLGPPSQLTLLEAQTLASAHVPPFPPDMPALLIGIDSRELVIHLTNVLLSTYPSMHEIQIVNTKAPSLEGSKDGNFPGTDRQGRCVTSSLGDLLENDIEFSGSTCIYVPALSDGTSFESFTEIVAHLRAPDGCPWDREQTHASLRTHLLEETYEALSAMDSGDAHSMNEEFGDLLLQIVLNAQIANESNEFSITKVVKNIYDKIIRRHPHVFGDVKVDGVNGVLQNWERLKETERGKKKDGKGLLGGVPAALPALTQAQEYQDRAARVGFDWPEIEGVLDKIKEEIEEIKRAETDFELASEIGDLFFAIVNLARWKSIDAESALRGTNMRFKKRFGHVEQSAKKQGRNLSDMTLQEMDAFWNEGKRIGL